MTNLLPSPIPYHLYRGQALPDPALYDYVIDSAGVVKRVRTAHWYAVQRVAFGSVRGLARYPEEGLRLSVPRIPAAWLRQVLEHARRAGGTGNDPTGRLRTERGTMNDESKPVHHSSFIIHHSIARPIEQLYFFHWKPISLAADGWQVEVPRQQASAARVAYRGGQVGSIVLELHSHHELTGGAYFSDIDNKDEQGARFYGVIGHIFTAPEIRLRLGLYGEFWDLPATCLFEGAGPFVDCYGRERTEDCDNEFYSK